VDLIHDTMDQRRGRVRGGPAGSMDNGCGGASSVCGAGVLEIAGAHQHGMRRTSRMRQCWRGAQWSTSDDGEAARR
jgi:hypothetical protein